MAKRRRGVAGVRVVGRRSVPPRGRAVAGVAVFAGRGGRSRGFRSKAQWRKFFADPRLRRWARQKAHATPGGPKVRYRRLPERKGAPRAGSAR